MRASEHALCQLENLQALPVSKQHPKCLLALGEDDEGDVGGFAPIGDVAELITLGIHVVEHFIDGLLVFDEHLIHALHAAEDFDALQRDDFAFSGFIDEYDA